MNNLQKEKLFELEHVMRDNAICIMSTFRKALDTDVDAAWKMLSGIIDYLSEPVVQRAVHKENENNFHNLGCIDKAEYDARKKRISAGDYNFI